MEKKRNLDEYLKELNITLLKMASLVEIAIQKATDSFLIFDEKAAKEVIEEDDEIDRLENEIDKKCETIFALFQPVASDLRFVMAALKINNDLERIGDMATSISKRIIQPIVLNEFTKQMEISEMCALTRQMLKDSLNSFVNQDEKLASEVIFMDKQVNILNKRIFERIISLMNENPNYILSGVNLVIVVRILERISDLTTNIAEDAIFLVKGKIIKHNYEAIGE
ncbi:phosphate signaling complex protein PhoU [bacterium]|nr:phosphate signaling complex protein PhoU [bacterium]